MNTLNALSEFLPSGRLFTEESMAKHTTFRIGGPAEIFTLPQTTDEFIKIINICNENETPFHVLGDGANTLVSDGGVRGAVIKTTLLNEIAINGETITALTGARLVKVSDTACAAGLTGFEFACGIPGTVGGGLFINAGAYGSEIKNVCVSADVFEIGVSPSVYTLPGGELNFAYRHSVFTGNKSMFVLSASFGLSSGSRPQIRAKMDELLAKRKKSQPLDYPSAGSAFKRPDEPDTYASRLIDECGLKGLSVGGAQISEKHAGFIINKGGATASDVMRLIETVQEKILAKKGIRLEPEVVFL